MRMTGKHEGCVFNGGTKEILNSKFWISGAYAGKSCKICHSWAPREGGRCWEGEKTKREVVGRQTTCEGGARECNGGKKGGFGGGEMRKKSGSKAREA